MLRIFISSTSVDLKAHRIAVQDSILSLNLHPVMMEYFTAMDANALEACRQKVQSCDVFIGIYAHRFGYIPDGQSKSITEMEYEWAIKAKLPAYIFVVEPSYTWPDEFRDKDEAPLEAFKRRVGRERVWNTFTTAETLAAKVTQCLVQDPKVLREEEGRSAPPSLRGILSIAAALIVVAGIGLFIFTRVQGNQGTDGAQGTALAVHLTETAGAPATNSPPTEVPVITSTPDCAGFHLASRISIGMTARVTPGKPNNLNTQPLKPSAHVGESTIITTIKAGETFTIIDGAVCSDSVLWWKVNFTGIIGWTGEGSALDYWIEPVTN